MNFIILSKYILSLTDIGIPLDIIRFINILYLQCEDEELCKKIYPCTSQYCKWVIYNQSKPGTKTCINFYHKKCILVHCQDMKCHKIICINRFQKSWRDVLDFTQEGFLCRKNGNEIWIVEECRCRRIFCDVCYLRIQNLYCLKNCLKLNVK